MSRLFIFAFIMSLFSFKAFADVKDTLTETATDMAKDTAIQTAVDKAKEAADR